MKTKLKLAFSIYTLGFVISTSHFVNQYFIQYNSYIISSFEATEEPEKILVLLPIEEIGKQP